MPWCKHHWSLLWAVDSHPIIAKRICASIPPPVCAPIAMTWSQLSHKTCNIDCMEEWQPRDVKGWNLSSTQIFCRYFAENFWLIYCINTLHYTIQKSRTPHPSFPEILKSRPSAVHTARSPQPYLQKKLVVERLKWSGIYALPATVFTSRDTHEITHVEHTLSVGLLQILHHGRLFFIILRGKLHFLHRLFPSLRS